MKTAACFQIKSYVLTTIRIEKEVCSIIWQIADAVKYCHANGISHRNLTPENILIDKNDNIKIVDFEQSKVSPEEVNLKKKDSVSEFSAPEFVDGAYDEKCDVWSIGVIMYYMLSGSSPFKGDSRYDFSVKFSRIIFQYRVKFGVADLTRK